MAEIAINSTGLISGKCATMTLLTPKQSMFFCSAGLKRMMFDSSGG